MTTFRYPVLNETFLILNNRRCRWLSEEEIIDDEFVYYVNTNGSNTRLISCNKEYPHVNFIFLNSINRYIPYASKEKTKIILDDDDIFNSFYDHKKVSNIQRINSIFKIKSKKYKFPSRYIVKTFKM